MRIRYAKTDTEAEQFMVTLQGTEEGVRYGFLCQASRGPAGSSQWFMLADLSKAPARVLGAGPRKYDAWNDAATQLSKETSS